PFSWGHRKNKNRKNKRSRTRRFFSKFHHQLVPLPEMSDGAMIYAKQSFCMKPSASIPSTSFSHPGTKDGNWARLSALVLIFKQSAAEEAQRMVETLATICGQILVHP